MGYAVTTSRIDSWNRTKTLNKSSALSAELLFFRKKDVNKLEQSTETLLFRAACAWQALQNVRYRFTYGRKSVLTVIELGFPQDGFHHLAGFQHLKDLQLPRANAARTMELVLNGVITQEQIQKGIKFQKTVLPRLQALVRLQDTLERDPVLYAFAAGKCPFHTDIVADYLIVNEQPETDFVFILKTDKAEQEIADFVCCSAFEKTFRDYTAGQGKRILLKRERIDCTTGETVVLYNRLPQQKK